MENDMKNTKMKATIKAPAMFPLKAASGNKNSGSQAGSNSAAAAPFLVASIVN
jgi:hypothetical protein